jgi:hypothetical protein
VRALAVEVICRVQQQIVTLALRHLRVSRAHALVLWAPHDAGTILRARDLATERETPCGVGPVWGSFGISAAFGPRAAACDVVLPRAALSGISWLGC